MIIKALLAVTVFAVVAAIFAAVASFLARRPVVVVYALLAVHVWELLAALQSVEMGGIGISPLDGVNILAAGVAAIRMRSPHKLQWPLVLVAAMILVAVARAVFTFGTGGALLGFRAELYFIVPAIYASTLNPSEIVAALKAVWRFGFLLAIIAVSRWMLLTLGIDIDLSGTSYAVERVINSGATLIVAVAAMIGAWRWLHDKSVSWQVPLMVTGMLLVVLLAQHRSVWVTTAAMLAILFLGTRARLWMRAGIAVTLIAAVAFVELFQIGQDSAIGESLAQATSNVGTWTWRLERWQNVWETHAARGLLAILFGSGYGYAWVSGAVGLWEVSPHNGYIQIAVRIGLVGALLLFGTYARIIIELLRRTVSKWDQVLLISTVGALVYYIPYAGNIFTGLLLGIALAQIMYRKHVPFGSRLRPKWLYPNRWETQGK